MTTLKTDSEKIAVQIHKFLRAFETDPNINNQGAYHDNDKGFMHLYHPSAYANGTKIGVNYVSYQRSRSWLTPEEAAAYLAWLKTGWVGSHRDFRDGSGKKMKITPYVAPPNEPKQVGEEGLHGDRTYEHPSWGTISACRTSGHQTLFGSALRHMHYISLRIDRGQMTVDRHGREGVHSRSAGCGEYIEVMLSEAQWGQMLSTPNTGAGTPCTINYVMGEKIPECPPGKMKARFHETIKADAEAVVDELDTFQKELVERFENSKPLTKAEKQQIIDRMSTILRGVGDKMPFVQQMFTEKLEEQVAEAKIEIDSFLAHRAHQLGMGQIREQVASLDEGTIDVKALPEVTDTEE